MTLTIIPYANIGYHEANSQPCVAYRNLLASGTITDGGLPSNAPRANAVTGSTFDFWQPGSVPATLRTTLAAAEPADLAFFAAHSLGSAGASVAVQYHNGTTWITIATLSPADDKPFGLVFPRITAAQWGLSVSGAVAQIGVAFIGPRVVIPGGVKPDYEPIWAAEVYEKTEGVSRRGHFFGTTVERAGASLSVNFMDVPLGFARDDLEGFRRHYNYGLPFVWASAPAVFPEDAAYCWSGGNARLSAPIRAAGEWVGLSMDMQAYVEAV